MMENIRFTISLHDPVWNRPSEQVACEISIPETINIWSHSVKLYNYCSKGGSYTDEILTG